MIYLYKYWNIQSEVLFERTCSYTNPCPYNCHVHEYIYIYVCYKLSLIKSLLKDLMTGNGIGCSTVCLLCELRVKLNIFTKPRSDIR